VSIDKFYSKSAFAVRIFMFIFWYLYYSNFYIHIVNISISIFLSIFYLPYNILFVYEIGLQTVRASH